MPFINETSQIGQIMTSGVNTTAGSIFMALLIIVLILMALCLMLGIRLEFSAILILPFLLACASYYSNFIAVIAVILIYLAIIITKIFIFR